MSPIRILIVDDSAAVRGIWKKVLSEAPDFHVAGLAENGQRALDMVNDVQADLVLLDIEMPVMDGITALPLLFKKRPGVRIIMASSLTRKGSTAAIQALSIGAADYVAKPSSTSLGATVSELSTELIQKIRALKYPIRERQHEDQGVAPGRSQVRAAPATVRGSLTMGAGGAAPKILVIGCSTGGPNALVTVLKQIKDMPTKVPIVVVQHMPPFFINLLAERVSTDIGRRCRVVADNDILESDYIGLAPGDFHTEIVRQDNIVRLKLNKNPPENFCRPAVDPLFRSASEVFGAEVLAVILTGMGEDGLRGCKQVHSQGGVIIAQDEASSVVWGMPGAVVNAGLAQAVLPVSDIGATIQDFVERRRRSAA